MRIDSRGINAGDHAVDDGPGLDGGHPVIDDKVIEDDAEAHAKVTKDYAIKMEELAPIWRMTGIL